VAIPPSDRWGNIFNHFSRRAWTKTPVAVFKIDAALT